MPIQSFKCKNTSALFRGAIVRKFRAFEPVAQRKLAMLDAAFRLEDLRIPPSNHLKALGGDRKGQHSIRVNDQFRLCFVWGDKGPVDVELVDYH